MNLQREKREKQADQADQNNRLSLKGGKEGKFPKAKNLSNIGGRQPDLEYEEERMREWRVQRRRLFAFTAASDFDLLRNGDSWIFPNSTAASALRGRHRRKCQSLSLSRKDDAKITSTTHRWDKNQISPRTILPTPTSSYATNCVLTSPTQVYFMKLLNHRFPEAHYNVFHGCIISTQKEPKSFDGLEILYFFYEI